MKIGFKLTKSQKAKIMETIDFCKDFADLRWISAFEKVFSDAYVNYTAKTVFKENWKEALNDFQNALYSKNMYKPEELHNQLTPVIVSIQEKLQKAGTTFVADFSDREMYVFAEMLDFRCRVVAGQWDMFGKWLCEVKDKDGESIYPSFFCNEPFIDDCRNAIISIFDDKKICSGASFGIMSHVFTETIRILYDVYEVFMYESCGVGCHAYKPRKTSNSPDPLPQIELEADFLFECTEDVLTPEGTEKFAFKEFSSNSRYLKKFDGYDGELFVPVSEDIGTLYQPLKLGDKVYLKKNGFYLIWQKGEKEPTIENRLKIS